MEIQFAGKLVKALLAARHVGEASVLALRAVEARTHVALLKQPFTGWALNNSCADGATLEH